MNRKDYIEGLEAIRKQVQDIGKAFASVDLTDATGMERDRRKKTAKRVGELSDILYEDIAISAKVAADKAEAGEGEQGDLFDAARKAEAEAEVVDVPAAETEPLALPAPADPLDGLTQLPGDSDEPKPTKKAGKASKKTGKGGKGKKTGKKGGK